MAIHKATLERLHTLQSQLDVLDQNSPTVTAIERFVRDGLRSIIDLAIESANYGLTLEECGIAFRTLKEKEAGLDEYNTLDDESKRFVEDRIGLLKAAIPADKFEELKEKFDNFKVELDTKMKSLREVASLEDAEKCTIKLEALAEAMQEGAVLPITAEEALRFENKAQLRAFFTVSGEGEEMDFVRTGISIDDALKILSYPQQYAIEKGISLDTAMKLCHYAQVDALLQGVQLDIALMFNNHEQVNALNAGVPAVDALKFSGYYQIHAFENGAPIEYALKFTNWEQVQSLKAGNPSADALCVIPDSTGCLSLAGESQEGSSEL